MAVGCGQSPFFLLYRNIDQHKDSFMKFLYSLFFILVFCFGTIESSCAEAILAPHLSAVWSLPFGGILLSIALFPVFASDFWGKHYQKIALFWAFSFLVPAFYTFDSQVVLYQIQHVMFEEYIPFVIFLAGLFIITGGIFVQSNLQGTPVQNLGLLTLGTLLASFIGTTGASMLLIRPILTSNLWRKHKVHVFIFFIFLVGNIGGSLTPLGDPPLFLGFLKGVSFSWTFKAMLLPALLSWGILLTLFFVIDFYFFKHDQDEYNSRVKEKTSIQILGKHNFIFLSLYVLTILISGIFPVYSVKIFGYLIDAKSWGRDLTLILLGILSFKLTSKDLHRRNHFSWHPILEVMILFLAIFITIVPVNAILKEGATGVFSPLFHLLFNPEGVPQPSMFFWITGILSSFLDNAPTYLIFFNAAGGDAVSLMGAGSQILLAISLGAVFMGANTYIGNAPNFMIKSIVEHRGVKMPSFVGYMLWSIGILIPVFIIIALVFLR
jgi:Na+/H+ antiporter NhaD/arsenite permease-like protein